MKSLSKKIIFIFLASTLFCSPVSAMHRRMHHAYINYEIPQNKKIIFIRKNPENKNSLIINVDENFFVNLIPTLTNYTYSCDFDQKCEITITSPRLSYAELTLDLMKNLLENDIGDQSIQIL